MADDYDKLRQKNVKYKKKILKYEEMIRDLLNDEDSEMMESSIFEKDPDGTLRKQVLTTYGDRFTIIDSGRNLSELNKSRLSVIQEQDRFAACQDAKTKLKQAGSLYGWGTYLAGIGQMIVWFA